MDSSKKSSSPKKSSPSYWVQTFGCKANFSDSQAIEAHLRQKGGKPSFENPDLLVINGCTVTDEADKQAKKAISRARRKYPKARILVTGCGAEVAPDEWESLPEVDGVILNRDKSELDLWDNELRERPQTRIGKVRGYKELRSEHPMDREWNLPKNIVDFDSEATFRTRAFFKIQEGCNSFCTFCIIPYGRGPARSLSIKKIIEEIRKLENLGIQEVVFTGTNIGDYGTEWSTVRGLGLVQLLEKVLSETGIQRIRVSSLDPTEIIPALTDLVASEARICSHFHVSLQSVCSKTLRRMKRRYRYEEVEECLSRIAGIRAPHGRPFVGMDLITGFPGETREMFEDSLEKLRLLHWDKIHVFPYSERRGTPATRMEGSVPIGERRFRARAVQELSLERQLEKTQRVQSTFPIVRNVLIEGTCRGPDGSGDWFGGYSQDYLRVLIPKAEGLKANGIYDLRLTGVSIDRNASEVFLLGSQKN